MNPSLAIQIVLMIAVFYFLLIRPQQQRAKKEKAFEAALKVDINNIQVIRGSLPNKQLRLILAWCTIHQDELMQNWELAKDMKPLNRINPLI